MDRRELAQAMRAGAERPNVVENHKIYIRLNSEGCYVCALGAAVVELYGGNYLKAYDDYRERYMEMFDEDPGCGRELGIEALAGMLGVDLPLASKVSVAHEIGKQTIIEIASWLESAEV